MRCENYSNLIDDLVESELDPQTAEEVNLHLLGCAECASQVAILQREKVMYSHYLFEIEPPIDLASQFQTRLETALQENIVTAQPSFVGFEWAIRIFAFLRLSPTLTTAILLVLLGLGLTLLNKQNHEGNLANQKNENKIQLMLPNMLPKETTLPTPQKDEMVAVKAKNEAPKKELAKESQPKPIAVKQAVKKSNNQPKIESEIAQLSDEEKLQIKEIQALEIGTVKQMEKVELLLRSFRNTRFVEGSEIFDISYESEQARKLLQTNIVLRQKSENYGTLFTAEMLNKVEPYLLDIANLDIDSTPEQVLEIKERVKSQNIIASLQGY